MPSTDGMPGPEPPVTELEGRTVRIGIPKETKAHEYRVAATPGTVADLTAAGHEVLVERRAGEGSGFSDEAYRAAGARLATAADAWDADLVVKIKEPQPTEYRFFREDLMLFAYLHLAADPQLAAAPMKAGTVGIAYETVQEAHGRLPLLAPMSEIAGRLAVQSGATYLQRPHGGRGILLATVTGIPPAHVVIVGGGVAGHNAAVVALGLGAHVQLLDVSIPYLQALAAQGWRDALRADPAVAHGLNVCRGQLTHRRVAAALGLPYQPVGAMLGERASATA